MGACVSTDFVTLYRKVPLDDDVLEPPPRPRAFPDDDVAEPPASAFPDTPVFSESDNFEIVIAPVRASPATR